MEKKCRSCGMLIPKGAMFCRHCKKLQDVYPTVIICAIIFSFFLTSWAFKANSLTNLPAPDTSYENIKAVLPQSVIGISQKDMRDYQTACISMNIEGIHMMKKSGRIIDLVGMPHVLIIGKESILYKVRVLEGKNKDLTGWIDFNHLFVRNADFKIDSAPDTNGKK